MSEAKSGDTVRIHYTGKLDDGTEFDSSAGREPLEFVLGQGQVIIGFDKAVEGMEVGDNKSVRIEPDDAYGQHKGDSSTKCREAPCRMKSIPKRAWPCKAGARTDRSPTWS